MLDLARLRAAYEQAKGELLAERTPEGHWVGELSSSALSTATAVSALAVVKAATIGRGVGGRGSGDGSRESDRSPLTIDPEFLDDLISRGIVYLLAQQNPDGGFGDTDLSHSNIATTMLVVAALHLAGVAEQNPDLLDRANAYIDSKGRLAGLRERYGIDKTFVVPIMTNCAIAGLIDWREIDPLPFELASVPQAWYRFVGMPVVSYAIPALVAIGQAQYFHAPPRNPIKRFVRWLSLSRSLKVLRRMQPDSGGYLEATPLTSFVVMSLASIPKPRPLVAENGRSATTGRGYADVAYEVIADGVKFLANSIRPDGSWPIDTNLATWNTTLAINALAGAGEDVAELLGPQCLDWLLSCQHTKRHAFTGADPGGFGWSDLSGAVPDADDTSGTILALGAITPEVTMSWIVGRRFWNATDWLEHLQNRDGGWPTFCRGWGTLPFDRSGVDLTAHAVRAITLTLQTMYRPQLISGNKAIKVGLQFIRRGQHSDGSWSPLWFGNQDHPTEDNPVYGTAKVLMAYRDLGLMDSAEAQRGVTWLVANQNDDGGWGSGVWEKKGAGGWGLGTREAKVQSDAQQSVLSTEYPVLSSQAGTLPTTPQSAIRNPQSSPSLLQSSVEETALAVEALLAACPRNATEGVPYSAVAPSPQPLAPSPAATAAEKGLTWLIQRVERGEHRQPAPIGFYFAKLWYYEKLYPLTFTVAALGRACRQFAHPSTTSATDRAPQPLGSP